MKRNALVTGTSSGIGLSTAVLLAKQGYRVFATLRDLSRADALKERARAEGVALEVRRLDVADAGSIEECTRDVLKETDGLDVLVNNAGFGQLGSVEHISDATLRHVMETNFFGVWNLTRAFFPSMRERGSGKIISVTSIGGLLGQPFNDAYCAAKFAVEGMMESLAPVAQRLGIGVHVVEPGPVHTEFVSSTRAASAEVLQSNIPGYGPLIAKYAAATQNVFTDYGQTPDQIAEQIVALTQDKDAAFRTVTSAFTAEAAERKYVDTSGRSIVEFTGSRLD